MVAPAAVLTLGFGDLQRGIWGAAWCEAESFVAFGTLDRDAATVDASASIAGNSAAEEWRLSGDAIDCTVSPEGDAVTLPGVDGFDQVCRIRGRCTVEGAVREFDAPGVRGSRDAAVVGGFESVRELMAWFADRDAIALTALRPPHASGQDRDLVVASLFDPDGAVNVADPLLSTTYAADGLPLRVGLELWMDQDESEQLYPRRAAGQALGTGASATRSELDLHARPLRWQSHGLEGAGIYLISRTR
jgi:hypothetical protein